MANGESGGAAQSGPLVGMRLGEFVIEGLLGKGAMEAVYRARNPSWASPMIQRTSG
ncbi:MAG: hypothetical protein IT577_19055 [Verrucomicrobiae bacterium]|nr:hypothetical protein [Verrucomicrobiae bacterium]